MSKTHQRKWDKFHSFIYKTNSFKWFSDFYKLSVSKILFLLTYIDSLKILKCFLRKNRFVSILFGKILFLFILFPLQSVFRHILKAKSGKKGSIKKIVLNLQNYGPIKNNLTVSWKDWYEIWMTYNIGLWVIEQKHPYIPSVLKSVHLDTAMKWRFISKCY